jgi:hypothetical protein
MSASKLMEVIEQNREFLQQHDALNADFYTMYAKIIFMEQVCFEYGMGTKKT